MEVSLTPIIKESFLQFGGAVLQSRALPDVRDLMKPSARQIFYCQNFKKMIIFNKILNWWSRRKCCSFTYSY